MAKKIFRSDYIQNLIADKESLANSIQETTKESLKGILDESVKNGLAALLNEADDKDNDDDKSNDEFDVEEVDTTATTDGDAEEDTTTDLSDITTDGDTTTDTEEVTDDITTDAEDGESDEEFMDSLESFKGEDGDYDLTGMGEDDLVKVYKLMTPDDKVFVVKKDNGTIEVKDEEHGTEYIIDLEGNCENGECSAEDLNEENLGYTDNYQNKTAMTTPANNEPGKNVRDWDEGAPHGTEKPWVGNKGDMSPYNKEVNENADECNNECNNECGNKIFEMEIECNNEEVDEATSVGNNARMSHNVVGDTNQSEAAKVRHQNKIGQNGGSKLQEAKELANLKRKATAIFNENQQLRAIAEEIKSKLNEAVVMNACLAKVVNLVTENSTTHDEKVNIINRFSEVKTLDESKSLYEQISNELKNAHAVNTASKIVDGQLTENKAPEQKSTLVETTMLDRSKDLSKTYDLMKRVMKY